jgi:hypothetical protein
MNRGSLGVLGKRVDMFLLTTFVDPRYKTMGEKFIFLISNGQYMNYHSLGELLHKTSAVF